MDIQVKNNVIQELAIKDIGEDFPKRKIALGALSDSIRKLLQNWRQGTVGSKGRSDVWRSGKKPWKQKGTGRARAGTARSPLWRGGGVIFGPQSRTRKLAVTKKSKRGVFNALLWDAIKEKNLLSLDWALQGEKPRTSQAARVLKQAGLADKKIIVFLPMDDMLHYSSFSNIPNVRASFFDEVNAYDLAVADRWVVLKKDLDLLKETVNKWI